MQMKGLSRLLPSDFCRSVSHQGTKPNLPMELNWFYAQTPLLINAEGLGKMERHGEGAAFKMSYSNVTLGFCFGVFAIFLCRVGLAHVPVYAWAFSP